MHGYTTRSIHVGSEPDPATGALAPSLTVSTTFKYLGINRTTGYNYARGNNPTRHQLERLLVSLETTNDSTSEAVVFASGSAATAAMCHWAVLGKEEGGAGGVGGHILAVNDVPLGIETTYLSFQDGEESIRRALRPDTKIIWLECPTNPTLTVPPLPLIASIVESLSNPPVVLIDTTFLSSFYFAPLLSDPPLADLVLSSLTKYTGGHTDIIMGAVVASGRAQERHPNIVKGLRFLQNSLGATASPRDCHLMLRSAKTLTVRMIRHGLNALRIAAWLQSRSEIADVLYPGLATDPAFPSVQQLISPHAKRELNFLGWTFPYDPAPDPSPLASVRALGIPFGGVLSFKLKATEEQIDVFVQNLRLTALAVSLGGVESLLEAPSSMTHDELSEETRVQLGITPDLIRFSVGLEDVEDIIEDLAQALDVMVQ